MILIFRTNFFLRAAFSVISCSPHVKSFKDHQDWNGQNLKFAHHYIVALTQCPGSIQDIESVTNSKEALTHSHSNSNSKIQKEALTYIYHAFIAEIGRLDPNFNFMSTT